MNFFEEKCRHAALTLDRIKLLRFDPSSGNLGVTIRGRVASHFYVQHHTMKTFLDTINKNSKYEDLLASLSLAGEYRN
jgi:hypothetical protein